MSHDLKFAEIVELAKVAKNVPVPKSPGCQECTTAYTANVNRAKALLLVPGFSFAMGVMQQTVVQSEYPPDQKDEYFNHMVKTFFDDSAGWIPRLTKTLKTIPR